MRAALPGRNLSALFKLAHYPFANSEAGTTQTVLEALAAILDAAGGVMRRKKTATHFRAAKYQSWGGLCSEGTNNIHRVYGRLMTRKLAVPKGTHRERNDDVHFVENSCRLDSIGGEHDWVRRHHIGCTGC
jgi:hypothetical protein